LNSEKILKILNNSNLYSEKISKLWKKSKSNRVMIWKNGRKIS